MNRVRQISAVVIAVSLLLPQRSCIHSSGHVEIIYPLSGADSLLFGLLIIAFYTVPLVALFVPRFRVSGLIAGIGAVAAGLYFFSYEAWLWASSVLVGWYVYTLGAIAYIGSSLVLLLRTVVERKLQRGSPHAISEGR